MICTNLMVLWLKLLPTQKSKEVVWSVINQFGVITPALLLHKCVTGYCVSFSDFYLLTDGFI